MADNVAITAGTGTTIATDDVGGVQYQRVKLVDGTLDSTNPLVIDASGRALTVPYTVNGTQATASWTSATALDTAVTLAVSGYQQVLITLSATTTLTAGTLNFEGSDDGGTTWFVKECTRNDEAVREPTVGLAQFANSKQTWITSVAGFTHIRVRLNPVITGTATVTLRLTPISSASRLWVVTEEAAAQTATLANVAASTASASIVAANAGRKGLTIYNDSPYTMYVAFAATATTSAYTFKLGPNGFYEMPVPVFNGAVSAIWENITSISGSARVTEFN